MENGQPNTGGGSSKMPLWIGIIVVVIILAGIGYFAFSSRTADEALEAESDEMMMEELADSMLDADDAMMEDSTGATGTSVMVDEGDVVADDSAVKTFELTGRNFEFSEEEIRVNQGDTVRIVFTSTDGFHDWTVDEFNAATEQVQTGGTTEVTFVASEAGTFEYYCSVGQHRQQGMVGNLVVE